MSNVMVTQWPTLRDGSIFDELAEVLNRELDYRQEALAQQAVADAYRDHPFVKVPDVITALSTGRVLVTEYIEDIPFAEICERDQSERDRYGEVIYRFFVGGILRDGAVAGDPHPGNILGLQDGRLCFLDFGMYHHLSETELHRERALIRAAAEGDAESVRDVLVSAGVFGPDDRIDTDQCLDFVSDAAKCHTIDIPIQVTSELATEALLLAISPHAGLYNDIQWKKMPAGHLISRRAEFLAVGLLGELRAKANWRRIDREWLYGEVAETDIGRSEEEWRSKVGRPTY